MRGGAAWLPVRVVGILITLTAVLFLLQAFVRFVREGRGTPAPVAPTKALVVGGVYRYVRNPTYLAVLAAIVGQAAFFGQPVLLGYAAVAGAVMAGFVYTYEEPKLLATYGQAYREYRHAVPGWLPRIRRKR